MLTRETLNFLLDMIETEITTLEEHQAQADEDYKQVTDRLAELYKVQRELA